MTREAEMTYLKVLRRSQGTGQKQRTALSSINTDPALKLEHVYLQYHRLTLRKRLQHWSSCQSLWIHSTLDRSSYS